MALNYGNRIVDDSIVFHLDFANRKCFAPNILNYSHWTVSSGSVPQDSSRYGVTYYFDNSGTGENSRVLGADPFGYGSSIVWRGQNSDTTLPTGDGGFDTGNFTIDNSKMYRFSVWTKRDQMAVGPTTSGQFFLGHFGKLPNGGVTFSVNKSTGSPFGNPYFHITPNPNPSTLDSVQAPHLGGINVWTLVVGHVWPVGTSTGFNLPGTNINGLASNSSHPDSGVWTRALGKIGNLNNPNSVYGGDWVWYPSAVRASHRAYLSYAGDNTSVQSFIYPRVDIVDGLEPTIEELLAGPEPVRDLANANNILYPLSTTDFDMAGRGLNFRGTEASVLRGTMAATFSVQTVSVWFSTTSTIGAGNAGQNVLQFGPTSSANYFVVSVGEASGSATNEVVSITTGLTDVGGTLNMTYFSSTTFAFQAGLWYNLVLSWSGTKYAMYINGVEVDTLTGGGAFGNRHAALYTNVTMAHIGSAAFTSGGVFYPYGSNFNGKIGSVLVYGRSLTPSEVRDNFNSMKQKYGII